MAYRGLGRGQPVSILVNLDAMIPREDFEVGGEDFQQARLGTEMKLAELLREGITYNTLRKPDFQRETNSWPPERIAAFIKSYLDGDLIPGVIMWRSPKTGNNFVVDGAHRLSALIAWVNDDYGAGSVSRPFFKNMIEPAQDKLAKKTRALVQSQVGHYHELSKYPANPSAAPDEETLKRARNIGALHLKLQWVTGDADTAEKSFYRINQSAAPIDDTEWALIQARRKPNAVAARALMRAGTGHAYWSRFDEPIRAEIEKLSADIYDELFRPVVDYPIKTLDLPVAGSPYSANSLKMVFDLVNQVNRVPKPGKMPARRIGESAEPEIPNDEDGRLTIDYLKSVKRAASRVSGMAGTSLGLHPGVYFYGATGKFQATSFVAALIWARELADNDQFRSFTDHRAKFEDFLLEHRHFVNQIGGDKGAGSKGLPSLLALYRKVLSSLEAGQDSAGIVASLKADSQLGFLREQTEEDRRYGRNFTKETKNAIFLREALAAEKCCSECGARLHMKSITNDHVERKEDGGRGAAENGTLSHPYCNTGYKEGRVAAAKRQSVS